MNDSMLEERRPVYDFDYIAGADVLKDVHEAYLNLKKNAPPLFWTTRHGGHWVANSADVAVKALRHPEIFSSKFLSIPPNPQQPKMIPESLDPPEHRPYRQMLRPFFEGKAIAPLEPRIIEWTEELVGKVVDELDAQEANTRETSVYKLKNATATEVARAVGVYQNC